MVRFKFRPDRKNMEQRKCISEHPFGTIKRAMGAAYFLLKSMRTVSGEKSSIEAVYFIQFSRSGNFFVEKRVVPGIFVQK